MDLGAAPDGACRQEEGASFYKQDAPLELVNPFHRGRAPDEGTTGTPWHRGGRKCYCDGVGVGRNRVVGIIVLMKVAHPFFD